MIISGIWEGELGQYFCWLLNIMYLFTLTNYNALISHRLSVFWIESPWFAIPQCFNPGVLLPFYSIRTSPGGSDGKASAYNVGDPGSIPGSGRCSGEGNGNPLQYSCLENPWMEERGQLQFMGSQRVGHDWATSLSFTPLLHCTGTILNLHSPRCAFHIISPSYTTFMYNLY